ncbi:RRM domain containing RNA-binding protein [Nitzschia inconspicua]|uniref:RRM domain containing RNA-binding protein n=1 Tax=Nitzschia inconspicua TaxID=303405 RepID=A0A9K3LFL4_9STRA|nr:RRM domain containing RNA-binding protein [Nitzschia inconspicua]
MWNAQAPPQPMAGAQQQQQKHDVFVGNLAFNTTEEQLFQTFSELGKVIKVRLVSDADTGKPRGYAFVEFEDPQAALSAIRNMNDYELNGRRIRVNFSSSSHLEVLANKLGMDLSQQTQRSSASASSAAAPTSAGTSAVADALKGLSKGEMYDIVAKLKEIADSDPEEARRLLSGHPQLPEALLFLMSKLDMIQTSVSTESVPGVVNPLAGPAVGLPVTRMADPRARDPRAAAAAARSDPRVAAVPPAPPVVDPRARMDPRARAAPPAPQIPLPPPPQPQFGVVPPPPPPAATPGVANLDPGLIQQVMSLTPQQISQLPPDKQQSILALRQQISGSMM